MDAVVAERTLEFYGDDGVGVGAIRVYAPVKDERVVAWLCQFEFVWPGFQLRRSLFAPDSWAVLFAVNARVPRAIAETEDFKAGRIGMFGKKLTTARQVEKMLGLRKRWL